MKILFLTALVFLLTQQQINAGVVRKPPAFATPVYSNSYLPAAMQVIFHLVDQLKRLDAEEELSTISSTTIALPTTSPHAPGYHQPSAEEQAAMQSTDLTAYEASTASIAYMASTVSEASIDSSVSEASTSLTASEASAGSTASEPWTGSTNSKESTASTVAINPTGSTPSLMGVVDDSQSPVEVPENSGEINEEKPEVVEEAAVAIASEAETPEGNYATPEINHEVQEAVQEVTESNQEIPEKNEGDENLPISSSTNSEVDAPVTTALTKPQNEENSSEEDDEDKLSSEESKEEDKAKSESSLSSNSEEDESSEEEDDEIRFTLIGEKVTQAPRPSLSNYLRKTTRAPLRGSLEDLATLYDALSKDARKQGLSKYSGYSNEVLQTLESSIEDGVGPQLCSLLDKASGELTRDDSKTKVQATLKKLANPTSTLSKDLKRLVPLRYIP